MATEPKDTPEQIKQFNEHVPASNVQGITAPNHKPTWLQEVEDDATFTQERRFREQFDEREREAQKRALKAQKGDK